MNAEAKKLKEMRECIQRLEKNALELNDLGAEIPVIQKNMQIVLSVVRNLKFGIVDPAKLMEQ